MVCFHVVSFQSLGKDGSKEGDDSSSDGGGAAVESSEVQRVLEI